MVDIVYDPRRLRLTARGHACGGEYGADPVCAGVSALLYTLAEGVKPMGNAAIRLQPGDALIALHPRPCCRMAARVAFELICGGLELIAEQYPDNVSCRVKK